MTMTAGQAAGLAESYAKLIGRQVEHIRVQAPTIVGPFVDMHVGVALGKQGKIPAWVLRAMERLPTQDMANIQFAGQDAATIALWRKHKTVYHIDDELWDEVGDAEDDTRLPDGVFHYLPHSDPFVAFPEPLLLPVSEVLIQKVDGFFVTGRCNRKGTSDYSQHSTAHPELKGLGLLLCGPLFHADGTRYLLEDGSQDVIFTRAALYDGQTVGEIVAGIGTNFLSFAEGEDWREHLPLMVRRAIGVLLYLCATNADLTPLPAPPVKRRKPGGAKPEARTRVVGVGYRLGAALRAHKKRQTEAAKSTGKTVRPHVRRAHLHTFKVGPGRAETRMKWLSRIEVNFNAGEAVEPTVNRVGKK